MRTSAEGLYGVVLLKRIRAGMEGLKGGLLPRDMANSLAPRAHRKDLARTLRSRIRARLDDRLDATDVDPLVTSERQALDSEWDNPERHLELAPGEEILSATFKHFGSEYKKTKDAVRIAQRMKADEIAPEVKELLKRAVSLPAGG